MQNAILVIQILLSVIVTFIILIQSKGSGLGKAFGGSSASFSRRGLEGFIFKFTFVIAALFLIISVAQITL